jgi:hypothetical protein
MVNPTMRPGVTEEMILLLLNTAATPREVIARFNALVAKGSAR